MATDLDWRNLLIETAIAKNYYWLASNHRAPRIPVVESITISGLLIRSVSILDDAVEEYITSENIVVPNRNPKLFHRLQALNTAQLLVNYSDIDAWRQRRNDVGHKVTDTYSWEELQLCYEAIYRELHHLNLMHEFPNFEVTKTIDRVSPSSPNVNLEQLISVKVTENGVVAHEFSWRLQA